MSFVDFVSGLATRIGTETKSIRTLLNGNVANLNSLTTTNKGNLILAINEINSGARFIYPSGIDITIAIGQTAPTTQVQVANTLRAFPWKITAPITLVAVRCEVQTIAAGSTFRLGIYADNGAGYPGSLVAGSDVATLDSAVIGVKLNTFASAIALNPGQYWLAVNSSGAPVLRAVPVGSIAPVLGVNPGGGANSQYTARTIAQTYASLPSTFPASAALLSNTNAPWAMFRVQ